MAILIFRSFEPTFDAFAKWSNDAVAIRGSSHSALDGVEGWVHLQRKRHFTTEQWSGLHRRKTSFICVGIADQFEGEATEHFARYDFLFLSERAVFKSILFQVIYRKSRPAILKKRRPKANYWTGGKCCCNTRSNISCFSTLAIVSKSVTCSTICSISP